MRRNAYNTVLEVEDTDAVVGFGSFNLGDFLRKLSITYVITNGTPGTDNQTVQAYLFPHGDLKLADLSSQISPQLEYLIDNSNGQQSSAVPMNEVFVQQQRLDIYINRIVTPETRYLYVQCGAVVASRFLISVELWPAGLFK